MPKYTLIGVSANAFNVMGYVQGAMRSERRPQAEIEAFLEDATSGDYNHLLDVAQKMVEKLNDGAGEIDDEIDDRF